MSRRKKDYEFWDSAFLNNQTFRYYFDRLKEIAISVYHWENLPETVDERFLELTLFERGQAVFFKDDIIGYLALTSAIGGGWNVYNVPNMRRAYATNGYNKTLNQHDSVVIYNSRLRQAMNLDVKLFARRLAEADRTIDVNIIAQKTPVFLQCEENQRLTIKNLYKQYDGNEPFIFGDKSINLPDSVSVLKTDAPFISPQLYDLKGKIWNEALNYLGIASTAVEKKERVNVHETDQTLAGVMASRFSRLESRRQAAEEINKMFGLNIKVNFRDVSDMYGDFPELKDYFDPETEQDISGGDQNE